MCDCNIPSAADFNAKLQPIAAKERASRIAKERCDIAKTIKSHMLACEEEEVKRERFERQQNRPVDFKQLKPKKVTPCEIVKVYLEDSMTRETTKYMRSMGYEVNLYHYNNATDEWAYNIKPTNI